MLNIPFALLAALVALWVTGQTLNLMTLGGLALAVGILVDEATVAVENIHTHSAKSDNLALAVWHGTQETTVPRLLGHALRAGRLSAGGLHGRGRSRAVRAAVAGRRFFDGRQLPAVEHVRAGALRLAAQAPSTTPSKPLRRADSPSSGSKSAYGRLLREGVHSAAVGAAARLCRA